MTQPRSSPPYTADVSLANGIQAGGTRTRLAHLPPEGFEPTPLNKNTLLGVAGCLFSCYTYSRGEQRTLLASTVSALPLRLTERPGWAHNARRGVVFEAFGLALVWKGAMRSIALNLQWCQYRCRFLGKKKRLIAATLPKGLFLAYRVCHLD